MSLVQAVSELCFEQAQPPEECHSVFVESIVEAISEFKHPSVPTRSLLYRDNSLWSVVWPTSSISHWAYDATIAQTVQRALAKKTTAKMLSKNPLVPVVVGHLQDRPTEQLTQLQQVAGANNRTPPVHSHGAIAAWSPTRVQDPESPPFAVSNPIRRDVRRSRR